MAEKTQFEVKFPTMDTSSSEGTVTDVPDYNLTHDKVRRRIATSQMDGYASLRCNDLNVTEELQNSETETFKETFESR